MSSALLGFEEAFELTGHGKFNYIVLATSGLVLLYANVECLGTGYIIDLVHCDFSLSVQETALISAATFVGVVSVAILWGFLSDRCGRRKVMAPTLLASACVSFCSSLSTNFWSLFVLRILTGALVSASSATVYAYLGEMHSSSHRPTAIAWSSAFISLSFIIMPGLAWGILPGKWYFQIGPLKIVPWRVFMWSWCVPAILAAILLIILPDSPRYLLANKGVDVVLPVLAKIYAWNYNTNADEYPVKELLEDPNIPLSFCESISQGLKEMLRPPLLYCVLLSHFCMFMIFLEASGMYIWLPPILNSVLHRINESVSICTIKSKEEKSDQFSKISCGHKTVETLLYPISMGMGVLFMFIYLTIGVLITKFGRRPLYTSIVASCSVLIGLSAVVPHPIAGITMLVIGLSNGCAASILAAISVEVFPTSIRALALCTLYMTGRFGAACGANILGIGIHHNCILVFSVCSLITASSTALLVLWPNQQKVRDEMESRGFSY